jgi:hypothetical protein
MAGSSIAVWGIAGAALLLGGLAIGLSLGGRRAQDHASPPRVMAAAPAAADEPKDAFRRDSSQQASTNAIDPPKASEPNIDVAAAAPASQLPAPPELPELPPDHDTSTSDRAAAGEAIAGQRPADPPALAMPEPAGPSTRDKSPAHVLKFDPLDFDPAHLSISGKASEEASPAAGSIEDPAGDIEVQPEPSPSGPAAEESAGTSRRDATLFVQRGPMSSEGSDAAARGPLAVRVDSLAVSDVPLVRFVEFLSDVAGAPITVDPAALELAGVSPRTALTVRTEETNIERLLSDAISPLRLELADRGGRVTIALAGGARWRTVDYNVKDLSGGADARQMASYIQEFVAPDTWQPSGKGSVRVDGTTLHVAQSQAIHHEILLFCERLRLSRGLAKRSRYPAERLAIEPSYTAIGPKLKARTTFTFLPWERFSDVIRFWQDSGDVTILVDWPALADAALVPSSPVSCSAIDRRWDEALDGILAPLGLAWWAIDGETIEITTLKKLDEIRRVEFYPIGESFRNRYADESVLVESLESDVRERLAPREPHPAGVRMKLDEPSGRLIVFASPPVHRYLSQRLRDKSSEASRAGALREAD